MKTLIIKKNATNLKLFSVSKAGLYKYNFKLTRNTFIIY